MISLAYYINIKNEKKRKEQNRRKVKT